METSEISTRNLIEGIITPSIPFADDDVLTNILDSESEYEDQDDQDIENENEPQVDLDPIRHFLPLKGINGPKNSLKLLGIVLGILMIEEGQDLNIRMKTLHFAIHIHFSHRGAS